MRRPNIENIVKIRNHTQLLDSFPIQSRCFLLFRLPEIIKIKKNLSDKTREEFLILRIDF